ncbi:MAG: DUF4249 domain-containing protein [Prolixibacteraceae bacterium]|nr:DUF4249 domain-containing protein [Prolixibacteraceae bacterium]
MKKSFCIFILLVFLNFSCVYDYDGNLPVSESIPVLNGILYTDSLFSFDLHWSNNLLKKDFEAIRGATVRLKKNGEFVNNIYNTEGKYYLNDTCLNGDKFEVEIDIPGKPTIFSKTAIPQKPDIQINAIELSDEERRAFAYNLSIKNISDDINTLYCFLFLGEYLQDSTLVWEQRSIYCDSPQADVFNRYFDSWAPAGFSYEYENFIRFPSDNLINNKLKTKLAFIGGNAAVRIYVLAATKEFDLYFKGGYLQRSFNPDINLPFTYQPIFLPSNIKGGAGIFAGVDLSLFEFP